MMGKCRLPFQLATQEYIEKYRNITHITAYDDTAVAYTYPYKVMSKPTCFGTSKHRNSVLRNWFCCAHMQLLSVCGQSGPKLSNGHWRAPATCCRRFLSERARLLMSLVVYFECSNWRYSIPLSLSTFCAYVCPVAVSLTAVHSLYKWALLWHCDIHDPG